MWRVFFVLLLGGAASLSASATAQERVAAVGWGGRHHGGFVGTITPPTPALAVYPGCDQPPNAPDSYTTSKDWYFNPNPSIGHPPAYYNGVAAITAAGSGGPTTYTQYGLSSGVAVSDVTNPGATGSLAEIVVQNGGVIDVLPFSWGAGVQNGDTMTVSSGLIGSTTGFTFTYRTPDAQSTWGNSTHPLDNLTAISGMFNFQQWALGWGGGTYQVLSGIAWYNNRSNVKSRDFDCWDPATVGCTKPLESNDPNHLRLWPGDTVKIQGDPTFNYLASTQGLNIGLNNGGATGSDYYVDANGKPVWLWIKNDPNTPTPKIYGVLLAGGLKGVIVQGLGVGHINNTGSTTAVPVADLPFFDLAVDSTALPTDGSVTLQLGVAGDTINETWTYKTTVSGANQIMINGSWLDILYNTYNEFLADATIPSVIPATLVGNGFGFSWKVGSGASTSVPFSLQFVSHQTSVVSGSTYVVNGTTYTAGTDFAIGSDLAATWSNFAAFIATAQPTVTVTELQPLTVHLTASVAGVAGAHLVRFVGITEPGSLIKQTPTMPATFAQGTLSDHIVNLTGTAADPSSDIIVDSNSIGSWDVGEQYSGLFGSYYPSTGSLGYNVDTGAHGAPGGAWDAWDVSAFESLALIFNGQYCASCGPNKSSTQITGTSCVVATNNYVHHAFTIEGNDVQQALFQGNIVNYSMNDNYDSYGAINTTWSGNTIINALYGANGVHSDGLQTGTGTGFTVTDMDNPAYFPGVIGFPGIFAPNVQIIRNKFYAPTDSALVSNTFHDMFNQVVGINNTTVSWVQGTEPLINSVFADNLLYGDGGVQFALVLNSVFVNNTGLLPGTSQVKLLGSQFSYIEAEFLSSQPNPAGNTYANNVLNQLSVGSAGESCAARGDTFATNLILPQIFNGVQNPDTTSNEGCSNSTSGTVTNFFTASNAGFESCNTIMNPVAGSAAACGFPTITSFAPGLMQAYTPLDTGLYDPTTLNAQPPGYPSASSGPLVCHGSNVAGVLTTNIDGLAWAGGAGCVGIGAY